MVYRTAKAIRAWGENLRALSQEAKADAAMITAMVLACSLAIWQVVLR
jgi:hypothetical protein